MFWSDFHSIHGVPSESDEDPGVDGATLVELADERCGARPRKGPVGESEKALPMHWVVGVCPATMAVK